MKCQICGRKAVDKDFCELHMRAYESVTKKYAVWKKALEISWREYLSEIVKNPLTGDWAKEVAKYLIKSGENQNVAES